MDETQKQLREANKKCLETAFEYGLNTEEGQKAYELAMEGYDRDTKIEDSKKNLIIKCAEIGSLTILSPIIEFTTKKAFAKLICVFEDEHSFITTAGRSLSGLFRFKK